WPTVPLDGIVSFRRPLNTPIPRIAFDASRCRRPQGLLCLATRRRGAPPAWGEAQSALEQSARPKPVWARLRHALSRRLPLRRLPGRRADAGRTRRDLLAATGERIDHACRRGRATARRRVRRPPPPRAHA